ncbi:Putative transposase [Micromonospora lupini str. Lupac 08]|uniref:Putative transposase n=2 Tax=Micromonospora lupini str. Lupac 08 TaxID=1150864 RepID=I0L7J2_9ACTN|nr:Putative transposase [Micromonospora lupini str. Lupac 08]CCH17820.1 Putative transposase [Micromonospora lupini str. Lupac 08]CCH19256.1 Putative transposase [Micromonospora lupini str. Lupac 08]CCH19789.1 putative transposase [Micromonospora lupini str. Lupac 08]CCH19885.1 Putative transposase [Micromonospora lupini str. Lupac 08]
MLDHVVPHIVADRVDVPVRPPQQPLHPVRRRIPGLLSQGPAVLTTQTRDQPTQVLTDPQPRLRPPKPGPDPGMQPVQLSMPTIDINIRHSRTNEHESNSIRLLPLQY